MRDILIHQYFGITISLVWQTATCDLPKLKKEFEKIIADIS